MTLIQNVILMVSSQFLNPLPISIVTDAFLNMVKESVSFIQQIFVAHPLCARKFLGSWDNC